MVDSRKSQHLRTKQFWDRLTGTFWHIWPLLCNHTPAPAPGSWLRWGAQEIVLHKRADVKNTSTSVWQRTKAAIIEDGETLTQCYLQAARCSNSEQSWYYSHHCWYSLPLRDTEAGDKMVWFYLNLHCCVVARIFFFLFLYTPDLNLHRHLSAALQPP